MDHRIESDNMGKVEIPADRYWGAQTQRALANFKGGYAIPRGPLPPKNFTVTSGGDKIALTWDVYASDPSVKEFRIYRAAGRYDGEYSLIHTATPDSRSFDDVNPVRGVAYYYYIQTVADASANTGAGLTPQGELLGNRIWTQTYDPAFLKRAAGNAAGGDNMDSIRVVPNPFSIRANATDLRFKDEPDKIAFFNIPGFCRLLRCFLCRAAHKHKSHSNAQKDQSPHSNSRPLVERNGLSAIKSKVRVEGGRSKGNLQKQRSELYSGMFPCFFLGLESTFVSSSSRALINRGRVSRGSMTASM